MAMPRERIHIWVPNIIRTYDVYIAEHKSKTVTGLQMYVIAGGYRYTCSVYAEYTLARRYPEYKNNNNIYIYTTRRCGVVYLFIFICYTIFLKARNRRRRDGWGFE